MDKIDISILCMIKSLPNNEVTKFATATADRAIHHLSAKVIEYDLLLRAARQRSIGL